MNTLTKEKINTLCDTYDIAVYQVGESCFSDKNKPDEQDKWFISSLKSETRFDTKAVEDAPLCETEDEAKELAVKIYKLADLEKKKLRF